MTEDARHADREERDDRRDNTALELLAAVRKLTDVVTGVDQLLRDEYPKRTEIERRFVTKLQQKTYVTRLVVVALVTVLGCYAFSTGMYAVCFVGQENPRACKVVPGYADRIERSRQIDRKDAELEGRIEKLEKRRAGR